MSVEEASIGGGRRRLLLLICLLTLAGGVLLRAKRLFAQQEEGWVPAQPIPEYDNVRPPQMVADRNRTVHAFYDETAGAESVILYRQWSLIRGWTEPVDILLPPDPGRLIVLGVLLDQQGYLHLMFFGGQPGISGNIYYSRAHAHEAEKAPAWSTPRAVAEQSGPIVSASLVNDGDDGLYLVYCGQEFGPGVYEIRSDDAGASWSEPSLVALVPEADRLAAHVDATVGSDGQLHAVWSLTNARGGLGVAVYYARRELGQSLWSLPRQMAEKDNEDYAADWASIIEYKTELFLFYMDGPPAPTRWMVRSGDGGENWTTPVRPFPHVGEYEHVVMLTDSNDNLHVLMGSRIGNPAVGGIWHAEWRGDGWGEMQRITAPSAQQAIVVGSYPEVTEASAPQAVISQGNVLLVAWWHNIQNAPPAGYTYKVLDAPALPVEPMPTPPVPARVSNVTAAATTAPVEEVLEPGFSTFSNSDGGEPVSITTRLTVPLLVSVGPVLAFVTTVGIIFFLVRHRRFD